MYIELHITKTIHSAITEKDTGKCNVRRSTGTGQIFTINLYIIWRLIYQI